MNRTQPQGGIDWTDLRFEIAVGILALIVSLTPLFLQKYSIEIVGNVIIVLVSVLFIRLRIVMKESLRAINKKYFGIVQNDELLSLIARANAMDDRAFRDENRRIVEDYKRKLRELTQGQITVDSYSVYVRMMVDEFRQCGAHDSVCAVSITSGKGWSEKLSLEYWQANKEALGRGASLKRVFLVIPKMLEDHDFLRLVVEHLVSGEETLIRANNETIKGDDGMVLLGRRKLFVDRVNTAGNHITVCGGDVFIAEKDIEDRLRQFDEIEALSEPACLKIKNHPAVANPRLADVRQALDKYCQLSECQKPAKCRAYCGKAPS